MGEPLDVKTFSFGRLLGFAFTLTIGVLVLHQIPVEPERALNHTVAGMARAGLFDEAIEAWEQQSDTSEGTPSVLRLVCSGCSSETLRSLGEVRVGGAILQLPGEVTESQRTASRLRLLLLTVGRSLGHESGKKGPGQWPHIALGIGDLWFRHYLQFW